MDDQSQVDTHIEHKSNKIYLYILGLVAVVFIVIAATLFKENKQFTGYQSQNNKTQSKTLTAVPHKGSFTLALKGNATKVPLSTPLNVVVKGNSQQEEVVGYDVLIKYDPQAFEYVSVTSLIKGFTVFAKDNTQGGVVSLTALKLPKATESSVFNSDVLQVTFRSKKKGTFAFSIVPKFNKETTKMVNDKTSILTPNLEPLTVEIF